MYTCFIEQEINKRLQEAYGLWRSAWKPTWSFSKVPHILPFYPRRRNWAYFHPRSSGFWDMGNFSKLPHLGMILGHWPKFQKLHIYTLFLTQWGQNWAYFRSTGSGFRDMGRFSKLVYLGMKIGHQPKFQKLDIHSLSTPGGWNWAYLRSTASAFRDRGDFLNFHIWALNLVIRQSARSCTYTLFLHQGVEIELLFALWAAVSEIWAHFQTCHIWAWNLAIGQSSRSCTYTFFLPQGV